MNEFSDWSTHLMKTERLIKDAENKLLNKRREGLEDDLLGAIEALHLTLVWVANNPEK